jgi:hypothetical protein
MDVAPDIAQRAAQPYAGISVWVTMGPLARWPLAFPRYSAGSELAASRRLARRSSGTT